MYHFIALISPANLSWLQFVEKELDGPIGFFILKRQGVHVKSSVLYDYLKQELLTDPRGPPLILSGRFSRDNGLGRTVVKFSRRAERGTHASSPEIESFSGVIKRRTNCREKGEALTVVTVCRRHVATRRKDLIAALFKKKVKNCKYYSKTL